MLITVLLYNGDYCTAVQWWLLHCCTMVITALLYNGDYCTAVQWWLLYCCTMVITVLLYNGDYCTAVQWWLLHCCTMVITALLYNGDYCTAVQWWLLYSRNSTVDNDDHDGDGVSCPMQTFVLTATDGTVETIYNTEVYIQTKTSRKFDWRTINQSN